MGKLTKSRHVKDIKKMVNVLDSVSKELRYGFLKVSESVAEELADQIFTISQQQVPYDEGDLYDSGTVERTKNGYEISYGKGMTNDEGGMSYAFFVHEDRPRGVAKNYTTPGTGPKYLESAVLQVVTPENVAAIMNEHVKKEIG